MTDWLKILSISLVISAAGSSSAVAFDPSASEPVTSDVVRNSGGKISAAEMAAASEVGHQVAEWLGPMAPVALSPFFGIACLSGLAMWGGDLLPESNPLVGPDSPLAQPALFWTVCVLTLATSLPRFTKVSKPVAQALDHVEAYAGIITLIAVRVMAGATETPETEVAVSQAGIFSFSAEVLLTLAMIVNVIVIHAVRYFFEFLVWITPIPFLDACFEVANKAACAGLLALYAWSPMLAALVNLAMFATCLLVFRWIHRRVRFYRTMAIDPLLSFLFPNRAVPTRSELVVFPTEAFGPFAAHARCTLSATASGWTLKQQRLLRSPLELYVDSAECQPEILRNLLTNTVNFHAPDTEPCSFSRRYNAHLDQLAERLNVSLAAGDAGNSGICAEFA